MSTTTTAAAVTTPPIKVGIVGYGFSTKCFHLPFILPNPELQVYAFLQRPAGVSQLATEKQRRWGHCTVDFPQARHYSTADDFFGDDAIELVIVCTQNHEEFVEKALNAGKHGTGYPPSVHNIFIRVLTSLAASC